MSLESSNMAGSALRTTFCLILLASTVQGLLDVEVIPYETIEAAVGQDVVLPCTIKTTSRDVKVINVEWSKKNESGENTKLAVYSPLFGFHPHQANINIEIVKNDTMNLEGFHLHLPAEKTWENGTYICHLTTFPHGSFRSEIQLQIKDVKIICDMDRTIQVLSGENVTVHCNAPPNSQYRWTKNKKLVSEKESLELWWVTDAQAGVYTLIVSTGKISLHKDFTITVLTVTTGLTTDLVTVSPQSNVTEEASIDSSDSSFTTARSPGLSTTGTSVTWTMSIGSNDSQSPSNVKIRTEFVNPSANYTDANVTSSPATHADPHLLLNSTTLSYGSTVFRAAQETLHTVTPSTTGNNAKSDGNGTVVEAAARSHLLVVILVPVLVLITLVVLFYRRHIIKKRMDLPPPFRPPPPPVKYTAAKYHQTSIKSFPISRCNSLAMNSCEINV
ncbi:T-cell surface protein tactile isoform X2 [Mastacembelus armatus]|uniref:T-cell surface protein tactile isoform X2 n=1 Tax=Mastacembelus armatus TaxID=205130 RepID=UPI000E457886|nr:T-cell surface protein tactile-like isoform X2 [Mastacembelus armatus]